MNLSHLRELAEKATPGPWFCDDDRSACEVFSALIPNGRSASIAPKVCETLPWTGDRRNEGKANAALIAALNPRTALALLAVAEAARKVYICENNIAAPDYELNASVRELGNSIAAMDNL